MKLYASSSGLKLAFWDPHGVPVSASRDFCPGLLSERDPSAHCLLQPCNFQHKNRKLGSRPALLWIRPSFWAHMCPSVQDSGQMAGLLLAGPKVGQMLKRPALAHPPQVLRSSETWEASSHLGFCDRQPTSENRQVLTGTIKKKASDKLSSADFCQAHVCYQAVCP